MNDLRFLHFGLKPLSRDKHWRREDLPATLTAF
jgi:hypothetical protein